MNEYCQTITIVKRDDVISKTNEDFLCIVSYDFTLHVGVEIKSEKH